MRTISFHSEEREKWEAPVETGLNSRMGSSIFYNPQCGNLWWWCHSEELKFSNPECVFPTYFRTKHMEIKFQQTRSTKVAQFEFCWDIC